MPDRSRLCFSRAPGVAPYTAVVVRLRSAFSVPDADKIIIGRIHIAILDPVDRQRLVLPLLEDARDELDLALVLRDAVADRQRDARGQPLAEQRVHPRD